MHDHEWQEKVQEYAEAESERVFSEACFRSAFTHSPMPTLISFEGSVRYVNDSMAQLLGRDKLDIKKSFTEPMIEEIGDFTRVEVDLSDMRIFYAADPEGEAEFVPRPVAAEGVIVIFYLGADEK